MATKRKYSASDKASALAALDANRGNLRATAAAAGIPVNTLRRWKAGEGVSAEVEALRSKKKIELATLLRAELEAVLGLMPSKRKDATYAQLATAVGILTDKLQLLSGDVTGRTESVITFSGIVDDGD